MTLTAPPVRLPFPIAPSQLQDFKSQALDLCREIVFHSGEKPLRGNKALNLYARVAGYESYGDLIHKNKGTTLPKGAPKMLNFLQHNLMPLLAENLLNSLPAGTRLSLADCATSLEMVEQSINPASWYRAHIDAHQYTDVDVIPITLIRVEDGDVIGEVRKTVTIEPIFNDGKFTPNTKEAKDVAEKLHQEFPNDAILIGAEVYHEAEQHEAAVVGCRQVVRKIMATAPILYLAYAENTDAACSRMETEGITLAAMNDEHTMAILYGEHKPRMDYWYMSIEMDRSECTQAVDTLRRNPNIVVLTDPLESYDECIETVETMVQTGHIVMAYTSNKEVLAAVEYSHTPNRIVMPGQP